uniref:Uncharacterized protein n=1 Tax=Arundo donax TaxID=35708 RepID=A0A0A9HHF8_ARUDO
MVNQIVVCTGHPTFKSWLMSLLVSMAFFCLVS